MSLLYCNSPMLAFFFACFRYLSVLFRGYDAIDRGSRDQASGLPASSDYNLLDVAQSNLDGQYLDQHANRPVDEAREDVKMTQRSVLRMYRNRTPGTKPNITDIYKAGNRAESARLRTNLQDWILDRVVEQCEQHPRGVDIAMD